MALNFFNKDYCSFPETLKYFPEQARNAWLEKKKELEKQRKGERWSEKVIKNHFQIAEAGFARSFDLVRAKTDLIVGDRNFGKPLLFVEQKDLTKELLTNMVKPIGVAFATKGRPDKSFKTLRNTVNGWKNIKMVGCMLTEMRYRYKPTILSGPTDHRYFEKKYRYEYIISAAGNQTFNREKSYGNHTDTKDTSNTGQVHVEQMIYCQLDAFLHELGKTISDQMYYEENFEKLEKYFYERKSQYKLEGKKQSPAWFNLSMKNISVNLRFYIEKNNFCPACKSSKEKFEAKWKNNLYGLAITL